MSEPGDCFAMATRRCVRFAEPHEVVGYVDAVSPPAIDNAEELWYTPDEYKLFERDTLTRAKLLQTTAWAKNWIRVYLILRTHTKASARMQAAVNGIPLTLTEHTTGLQGRYLAPIWMDFHSQRRNLLLHMSLIRKQIKDPDRRAVMCRDASRLYTHAPGLYAILAAHVAVKE